MTGMQIGQMSATLEAFGMKHAARSLPDLLEVAERNELSCRDFLERVLASETEGRFARKRKRNYASAHFPPGVKPIDEFDPSELESLPRPAPSPKPTELPPRAKEILALHAVEEMRQERSPVPESDWRYVAGLFGFPVEQGAPELSGHPWITWGVAALCLVVYLLNWDRCGEMAGEWGLIPSQCLRKNGLTFVTSMFLHGNLWHLAGNLYFLLIFGDNVEDALGTFGYLALLLAAGLSASMVHIVFGGNPNIPCVGASGFSSGIIAAYAVFFPTLTIQMYMRFHWA